MRCHMIAENKCLKWIFDHELPNCNSIWRGIYILHSPTRTQCAFHFFIHKFHPEKMSQSLSNSKICWFYLKNGTNCKKVKCWSMCAASTPKGTVCSTVAIPGLSKYVNSTLFASYKWLIIIYWKGECVMCKHEVNVQFTHILIKYMYQRA